MYKNNKIILLAQDWLSWPLCFKVKIKIPEFMVPEF